MQLIEYWRRAGRRRWLLLVLPLLAMAAVTPVAAEIEPNYLARARVKVSEINRGPVSVRRAVEDYGANVTAGEVVNAAAEEVEGVSTSDIYDGLSAEQVGDSNYLEVTYEGSDPERAEEVVAALVAAAWRSTAEGDLILAREQALRALQAAEAAQEALTDFYVAAGDATIAQEYRQDQEAQDADAAALEEARAAGDTALAAEIEARMAEREASLDMRTPIIASRERLIRREGDTSREARRAMAELAALQAETSEESFGALTDFRSAEELPTRPRIVRLIAGTGVVAVLLSALGLLLLELVLPARDRRKTGRHRRRRRSPAATEPAATTAPPGDVQPGSEPPPAGGPDAEADRRPDAQEKRAEGEDGDAEPARQPEWVRIGASGAGARDTRVPAGTDADAGPMGDRDPR